MRVAGHRTLTADIATPRIWKVAILTAAGAIGTASRADAALYYWRDSAPSPYYQQDVQPPPRSQPRARKAAPKKNVVVKDTTVHPQMPLVIAVSIQKQQVRVYDANGFFAEAPVSTGMPGHPTPMGVFSVIEKDRYHHSNIYSGAPMPFMQRITWSGVAMHAGVLPGYPASHGCIRMPEAFAIKMWGWTKMGARVIVTPGELPMPISFTHALLPSMKVAPPPPVAEQPETNDPVAAKADKGAPEITEAKLELRPTVGHVEVTPVVLQTRTADASGDGSDVKSPVTMSDAPKLGAKSDKVDNPPSTSPDPSFEARAEAKPSEVPAAKPAEATPAEQKPAEAKPQENQAENQAANQAASQAANSVPATAEVPAKTEDQPVEAAAKPDGEAAKPEDEKPDSPGVAPAPAAEKTADAKSAEPNSADVKTAEKTAATDGAASPAKVADAPAVTKTEPAPAEATVDAKAQPPKPETAKVEPVKAEPAPVQAKPADATSAKAAEPAKAAAVADAPSGPKDQTRIVAPDKPKQAKRHEGQIAVFISRKDSKLYVRQNFAPLFDVPVTIAPGDRPLGTHVFTAEVDKNDPNLLHWSVVTVPSRAAMREEPRAVRNKKGKLIQPPVEAKPAPAVDTPAEALDRITIPPDTMARILEALTTGGSIIVSDQGINQGETGEGTDFIVSLR
jgi:lipoprotein-anchoring transpeptidase ErfK/SrfK